MLHISSILLIMQTFMILSVSLKCVITKTRVCNTISFHIKTAITMGIAEMLPRYNGQGMLVIV